MKELDCAPEVSANYIMLRHIFPVIEMTSKKFYYLYPHFVIKYKQNNTICLLLKRTKIKMLHKILWSIFILKKGLLVTRTTTKTAGKYAGSIRVTFLRSCKSRIVGFFLFRGEQCHNCLFIRRCKGSSFRS